MDGKEPCIELIRKDVMVWDPKQGIFILGRRRDILLQREMIELKWTNVGTSSTDQNPDNDIEIDIEFATEVIIQIDTTHNLNVSTDIDVNVESSLAGGPFDTIPYAERNIGDAKIKTFLIDPAPTRIRLRVDNNDGANAAYVTARILVTN